MVTADATIAASYHPEAREVCGPKDLDLGVLDNVTDEILRASSSDALRMTWRFWFLREEEKHAQCCAEVRR